jgi:hypothetical protein
LNSGPHTCWAGALPLDALALILCYSLQILMILSLNLCFVVRSDGTVQWWLCSEYVHILPRPTIPMIDEARGMASLTFLPYRWSGIAALLSPS